MRSANFHELASLARIATVETHCRAMAKKTSSANPDPSALPLGSGLALLVFFAIALQCVSTVAILAKEANSWKLALRMVIAYLSLAWLAAWVTFQITGFLV